MERIGAIVRDGDRWIVGGTPARVCVTASGSDAFAALDEITNSGGFWVGYLAYDLGRAVEHVDARTASDTGHTIPDLAFARFDDARFAELPATSGVVHLGPGTSSLTREEHAAAVDEIQALLRAGECYQVNLTRRLTFAAAPEPLSLFGALVRENPAPHAALCTFGDALPNLAVVSASPELFLRVDGRSIETRPIKGTSRDANALRVSAKDHAENVMIVDLARNDLGRVCEFGSVVTPSLCSVEPHPGLYHLVSTVRGRMRADVTFADTIRATFPPASVTGAPKPRVMQAIEDLEPVRRGVYCGAVGWIDADHDRAELAVAIRTFTVDGADTTFGVGGGVVADSTAADEWNETEIKAARLLRACGAHEIAPVAIR